MTFTNSEKHWAAKREVAFRRRVYSKRVAEGLMQQAEADRQIGLMEAIAADYAQLDAPRLPLSST